MSHDHFRRSSSTSSAAPSPIPSAPPLPAPKPLQRARDVANKFFGYQSRPLNPYSTTEGDRFARGAAARNASLTATENATASHKTGLEINTIAINERGTHALIGGKDIFKTVKVVDGTCVEDLNLRSAIRSAPTQASGKARQTYSIDVADVAWAKGDCGDYVAAATSSGKIILYDLGHAGLQAAQLHEHFRQVHKVTFNPHRGNLLLSGSQDGTVRLWDVRDVRQASTLQSKRKFSGQSDGVRDVKWSPTEGVDFAFGTDSGWIQRWDMRNLRTAKVKIPAHTLTCNAIDWHPDGKHIVSASADKTVRVWDFSTNRRQKSGWEIKTPYPVVNARWRPPCESLMPHDNGARQCTQLVTAYDRDHPVLHIWDFRRPALPFREMAPYPSSPTDLLWHSQDLLWTVGREGVFLQADIQHAPKVIDKRNLQAFAISPQGGINLTTQKRRSHRTPEKPRPRFFDSKSSNLSQSPQHSFLSRSWADDSLDHSFLSVTTSRRRRRSGNNTRSHSITTSVSYDQPQMPVLKLDEILLNRPSFRPHQSACRVPLPGDIGPQIFTYLARNYKSDLRSLSTAENFSKAFEGLVERNARCSETVGLYRLAQMWEIVSFSSISHLREREATKHRRRLGCSLHVRPFGPTARLSASAKDVSSERHTCPVPTPATMKPVSSIVQQLALPESTSNQPTPLARPISNGEASALDPEKDDRLSLPPLLAPDLSPNGLSSHQRSELEPRLTASNLDGLQKLEQNSINMHSRADLVRRWSVQPKQPLNLDPVDADGVKVPPKLEKHDSNESFTFLAGSIDSREPSFPSSFASTGSGPLKIVAERPSRSAVASRTAMNGETDSHDFGAALDAAAGYPFHNIEAASAKPMRDIVPTGVNGAATPPSMRGFKTRVEEALDRGFGPGSYPDENGIHPFVEQTISIAFRKGDEIAANATIARSGDLRNSKRGTSISELPTIIAKVDERDRESLLHLPEDDYPTDVEADKPFTLVSMLRELVFYSIERGNAQTAAHLLLLIGPVLPRTQELPPAETFATVSIYVDYFTAAGNTQEDIDALLDGHIASHVNAGMQPLQTEAVLTTYQDQLMSYGLLNEATLIRKLAYPAHPAVYDHALKDNSIHLKCGKCGKPVSTDTETLRCESCGTKQGSCPICWSDKSPFGAKVFHADMAGGSTSLHSTCLLCNHSGHAACLFVWFSTSNERDGGCPTEGCLCDCINGTWRAAKAKMAESIRRYHHHGRVKSDEWSAKESEAVERTRAVLGVGSAKGNRSGFRA